MNRIKLSRFCIITCPLDNVPGGQKFVDDIITILEPFSKELYVITHNYVKKPYFNHKIHILNVSFDSKIQPLIIRIIKQVLLQLRIAFNLVNILKHIDSVIFYLGSRSYILSTFIAWLSGKKLISIVTGSGAKSVRFAYAHTLFGFGGIIFSTVFRAFENINYKLSHGIIAESEHVINHVKLDKYKSKIFYSGVYFDVENFKITQSFSKRKDIIGYIGRFSAEKGILNFIKAIPLILRRKPDLLFLIGGGGFLFDKVNEIIKSEKLSDKVILKGWIKHEDLVDFYNNLKLLVIPSYSESIPIVAVEAMACGTIVLANPVGGVPDVIIDKENGFLLKNNSPECISDKVIEIMENYELETISKAAYESVQTGFSYESAINRYRIILENIYNKLH